MYREEYIYADFQLYPSACNINPPQDPQVLHQGYEGNESHSEQLKDDAFYDLQGIISELDQDGKEKNYSILTPCKSISEKNDYLPDKKNVSGYHIIGDILDTREPLVTEVDMEKIGVEQLEQNRDLQVHISQPSNIEIESNQLLSCTSVTSKDQVVPDTLHGFTPDQHIGRLRSHSTLEHASFSSPDISMKSDQSVIGDEVSRFKVGDLIYGFKGRLPKWPARVCILINMFYNYTP